MKNFLLKLIGWENRRKSNWTKAIEAQGEMQGLDNIARKQRVKESLDKSEEERKLFEQQVKKLDESEKNLKND